MKIELIFLGFLICTTVFSCKEEPSVPQPECPECWDDDMACINLQCECEEGTIINWLEAWSPQDKVKAPRKFCIERSPYTFIAEFEAVGCLDTFAITFPWEPLTEIDPGDNSNGPAITTSFRLEMPEKVRKVDVDYTLFYNEIDSLELYFFRIPANTGGEDMGYEFCTDYDENGERIGRASRAFSGVFVHPDTIRGQLVHSGHGTLDYLDGLHTPIDLVRTVPYEQ